jgi:hypothetical protein
MIDTSASSTVSSLKLVDILTLIALVTGPAIAVLIQLLFEERRSIRRDQRHILLNLMAYRGRLADPVGVGALNSVQIIFSDDKKVIEAHRSLLEFMERERELPPETEPWRRRDDLTVELIAAIAESLGHRFTHTDIKARGYFPKGMVDENAYQLEMRGRFLQMTKDGAMSIRVKAD